MVKDIRINQMWECAYKYDYCIIEWVDGTKRAADFDQLKGFLKAYEYYLETEEPTTITGSNGRIYASIDDRLTRFMRRLNILSIDFTNGEEFKDEE